jgi:hypothetical protein
MNDTFEQWRTLVYEQMKSSRPDMTPQGVSPDALHDAFREGLSPAEFCALPAEDLTRAVVSVVENGPTEFRNSRKLCIGNSLLFYVASAMMVVALVLLNQGAFGKPVFLEWATLSTLAVLSAVIGTAYLLMLRSRWLLFDDRLEFTNAFGKSTVIRKDDVVSFSRTSALQSYVLKDRNNSIYAGRPIEHWQPIHDVLNDWAANEPGT